jgi:hypothetical protein
LAPQSRGTEPAGHAKSLHVDLNGNVHISPNTPLLIAASKVKTAADQSNRAVPTNHFNGRIDALQIETTGDQARVLAKYDFAVGTSGDNVSDVSGNGRHGVLINAPSRAMKGHDWDGSETDWTKAKYGYGAIHFHEDDLDDAGWETDLTIQIPKDARSGVYGVEIKATDSDVGETVVFFVRPTSETTSKVNATEPKSC